MAVREFNGSTDGIICSIGTLAAVNGGAATIAYIGKRTIDTGDWRTVFQAEASSADATQRTLQATTTSGNVALLTGFNEPNIGVNHTTANGWVLIAVTKAAGSVTIRGHKYIYSTGVWTHANGGAGSDSGTLLTGGNIRLGRAYWGDGWQGRLALVGAWKRELSDAELNAMALTLQSWVDEVPDGLWPLNQAAVTDAVQDISGNGANQTSRTGTTVVVGDDPPGFNFSLGEAHSGGSTATVTVDPTGSGSPSFSAGSTAGTDADPLGGGSPAVSSGSSTSVTVDPSGAGEVSTAGGSVASVAVDPSGAGSIQASGGSTASVTVQAFGGGTSDVEVDLNVVIGPSRTGSVVVAGSRTGTVTVAGSRTGTVAVAASRSNGVTVGPTRDQRGN